MGALNKVILLGELTRDPELRTTNGGTSVCMFGLVMDRHYTSGNDNRVETTFVDVTVYGRTAEAVAQYMRKGSTILVEGRLHLDQWDTKDEPPQKRSKLIVIGENIKFVGGGDAERQKEGGGRW